MDIMKVKTNFLKGIINRLIRKYLRDNYGVDCRVYINDFELAHQDDGMIEADLSVKLSMSPDEILKVLPL